MSFRLKHKAEKLWRKYSTEQIVLKPAVTESSGFLNSVKDISRGELPISNCAIRSLESEEKRKRYGTEEDTTAVFMFLKKDLGACKIDGTELIEWNDADYVINAVQIDENESEMFGVEIVKLEVKRNGN